MDQNHINTLASSQHKEKLINATSASHYEPSRRSEMGERDGPVTGIATSPRRFLILFIFVLTVFLVNAAERVKLWFRDASGAFTFLVYMDNVIYVVMFFPAVIFIEKFGMRISFIAAIALSLIGSWIALTVQNKGAQVFGQLLIDCGFPLVASAVTKVPAQWFPFKERFYATSVGIMAGMFGYALGDTTEAIFGKENAINFAITLTVIGGVIITLLILFYQDTPNEPPSVSQAQKEGSHLELKGDLAILLKDTAFLLATISTALYICFTVDVSKGLANIIKLGDIDIQDIEGITIFFYVPGIISIMLPAFFLGRGIMLYRTVYLIVEIVAFVAVGILVVAIAYASENQQFLYISSIVNGFVMSMNMPLAYEIVAEQGYPFSEALTAGAVHAFYALFRLILKGLNRVLDEDNAGIASTAYCFVLIVLVFLSFILMFFAKIKHRRLKMELKADK